MHTLLLLRDLDVETQLIQPVVITVVIGAIAIAMLLLSLWVMDRLTPFSLRKEIEEDHNISAAIVMGSIVIGVALVIAAVAHG